MYLKFTLIVVDYIVFFEEFIESCKQNFVNYLRKISQYRNGPVIIHVISCSSFIDGDNSGNFAITRKNTSSKHVVEE